MRLAARLQAILAGKGSVGGFSFSLASPPAGRERKMNRCGAKASRVPFQSQAVRILVRSCGRIGAQEPRRVNFPTHSFSPLQQRWLPDRQRRNSDKKACRCLGRETEPASFSVREL